MSSPPQHTVSIQQVHGILLGARHTGLAIDPLLDDAGIQSALLESPLARVSQRQYAKLVLVLRRKMRDELWGLLSSPLRPGTFGQCMRRATGCATLREAMREAFSFYHLQQASLVPRLSVANGIAKVQIVQRGQEDMRLHFGAKAFALFTFNAASWLVARRIPLLGVDYTAEQGSADMSRVYQVPIRYGQPHVGFAFEARWLTLPVVQSPESLREFLQRAPANLIVKYRDSRKVSDRVGQLLCRRIGGDLPTVEEVAKSLAMTPQTLRRRLREEGRVFRAMKDEIRRDAAVEFLTQTMLPLQEVATRVGFFDLSTFHRAFKHWTGVAPGTYRAERAR
ncbi:MAG TPA: AraC family transcriptional regulator ligand-binding domain-containing protein [Burkholderiaceae bacterium]|nr:AraC family transcriptional regulator ligand-binding domain-containing protein [Burkholderiaceae bacterium]